MARVFISYSRTDRPFVDEFVPLLRKVYGDAIIWYDEAIPGGHQWWQVIVNEITNCDLFIYLISNDALASPYCQEEFRHALRLQKPFLPVTIRSKTEFDDKVPDDLRRELLQTQYVDLSAGLKDYQSTAALYAALNNLLREIPPPPPAPLPSPPAGEFTPQVLPPHETPRKRLVRPLPILFGFALISALILVGLFVLIPNLRGGGGANSPAQPTRAPVTQSPTNVPSGQGGYTGVVSDRDAGQAISGAQITFVSEDGASTYAVASDNAGRYRIALPVGRYHVTATHDNYETYSTESGFFVVRGPDFNTGNIFMIQRNYVSCAGTPFEGSCWYFGEEDASCEAVCSVHGGYDEATMTYAGSGGSANHCRYVLEALSIQYSEFYETTQGGIGCFTIQNTSGSYFGYWDEQPTTASASYVTPGRRRLCACQQ